MFFTIVLGGITLVILSSTNNSLVLENVNRFVRESNQPKSTVTIGDTVVYVDIVSSAQEIEQGLGDKNELPRQNGMLFDFGHEDTYPIFWMKGMRFPIDIIWINNDKVVQIDENAQPPDRSLVNPKLPLYRPLTSVDLVLEVNAGFTKDNSIEVGDSIIIRKI